MGLKGRNNRVVLGVIGLIVPCALSFTGIPFALVGGAYIIMAAYIVRSLPASVRAGVASLQQIDPSIEEASNSLGADAQYTFRKVTLPLISACPAGWFDLQFHPAHDQPIGDHLPSKRKMAYRNGFHSQRMGTGRGQYRGSLFHRDHYPRDVGHRSTEPYHETDVPRPRWD